MVKVSKIGNIADQAALEEALIEQRQPLQADAVTGRLVDVAHDQLLRLLTSGRRSRDSRPASDSTTRRSDDAAPLEQIARATPLILLLTLGLLCCGAAACTLLARIVLVQQQQLMMSVQVDDDEGAGAGYMIWRSVDLHHGPPYSTAAASSYNFSAQAQLIKLDHAAEIRGGRAGVGGGYTPKSKEPSEAELWPRDDSPWNASALQSLRTAFHFQPPNNWMNDPNAPLFYKGWYHLFYQYNPKEAYWGLISWGHTVSKDLIHWLYVEPLAMVPDHYYDENGVWTGSATMLPTQQAHAADVQLVPAIMYTGSTNESVQVQNVAFPASRTLFDETDDGLLVEWTKIAENPVLKPPAFINATDFRDPTTAWRSKDGLWTLAIGSHLRPTHTGMALLYQSSDFVHWTLVQDKFLHLVEGSGMWECVDFYAIAASGEQQGVDTAASTSTTDADRNIKHVLKASMDDTKLDFYSIGTYDVDSLTFTPDAAQLDLSKGYRYDYGRYYASKTFFDPLLQRRILFGWVNESDTRQDDVLKGWSGVQSIPRQVWFDNLTQDSLLQWPIEEITSLYKNNISLTNVTLESGDQLKIEGAEGAQWDITLSFAKPTMENSIQESYLEGAFEKRNSIECDQIDIEHNSTFGPFGIYVLSSEDLQEHTGVFFYLVGDQHYKDNASYISWKTLVCNDLSRSSLASHVDKGIYGGLVTVMDEEGELFLRILVDHSIVETFAQRGRTVITSRVYPTLALDASACLYILNHAKTKVEVRHFQAYELSSINTHYITPQYFDDRV